MAHEIVVADETKLDCGQGGTITIRGGDEADPNGTGLLRVSVTDTGYVGFDDFYVNSPDDLVIDASDDYTTEATVKHITEDEIVSAALRAVNVSATVDLLFKNLQPEAFYRLYTDGTLAMLPSGAAHGMTDKHGEIGFDGVSI